MLFNKTEKGTEDLRKLISFLYKSIKFEDIVPDLELAHEEMEAIVGSEVMEAAEDHYLLETYETPETDEEKLLTKLVNHLQLPIAYLAYKEYAATNDISHDSNGRKMVMDPASEKMPFEWLLERDDHAILSKAYKTTDRLIKFLDDNFDKAPISTTWATSEAYGLSKLCFINSATEFDAIFPIEKSRRFFLAVLPLIKENELLRIRPVLGITLFDAMKEKIKDQDLTIDEKALLPFINVPLVLMTMRDAVKRLSVQVLPNGVFQNYISDRMTQKANVPALQNAKTAIITSLDADIKEHMKLLQSAITKLNADPNAVVVEAATVDVSAQKYIRL